MLINNDYRAWQAKFPAFFDRSRGPHDCPFLALTKCASLAGDGWSNTMNGAASDFDHTDETILTTDVSDEELEAAAEGKCAWLMPSATFDAPCC